MSATDISCVYIHKGYQPYLKYNLQISSKKNKIFLIGDDSVKPLRKISKNITFIDINKYENSQLIESLKKSFTNYSSNSYDFEWFCFARIFILSQFLNDLKINKVFYSDSDNIILSNINEFNFLEDVAFIIPKEFDEFRMSASIHSSLLTRLFCDKFISLYKDIYENKSKFHLIDDKISHHEKNNIPGGICDMTLYYLLNKEGIIKPQNLIEPLINKNKQKVVFMNHINTGEGPDGEVDYEMENNKLKIYPRGYIKSLHNNEKIAVANIHFQGEAKKELNRFTKFKFRI